MKFSPTTGSPEGLRRLNRQTMLRQLLDASPQPLSRKQIADQSGLTGTLVSRMARELLDAGLIAEGPTFGISGKAGRRHIGLEISARGAFVVGIGLAAHEQCVSVANMRGDILCREQIRLPGFDDPPSVLKVVVQAAHRLIDDNRIDRQRILGGGVSIAGIVDPLHGIVLDSPNLNWHQVDIKREVEESLGLPCLVESHPNAVNLAEHWIGITRAARNVVLVNVALGIGGSLIQDGYLIRGEANRAGRIGHIHVPGAELPCSCGKVGCLDTVASGQALLTRLGMSSQRWPAITIDTAAAVQLENLLELSRSGDTRANDALHAAGRWLGLVLNAVTTLTAPAVVVLAGPTAQNVAYAAGVRETLELHTPDAPISLRISQMPRDTAGMWLALNHFAYSEEFRMAKFL
jgi:predicted NBD/HSP70 family sugar kinase